ncbi:unnamed protein product [Effrenium voratum]|nr:unnamed protein product [Effrenium voratum]
MRCSLAVLLLVGEAVATDIHVRSMESYLTLPSSDSIVAAMPQPSRNMLDAIKKVEDQSSSQVVLYHKLNLFMYILTWVWHETVMQGMTFQSSDIQWQQWELDPPSEYPVAKMPITFRVYNQAAT